LALEPPAGGALKRSEDSGHSRALPAPSGSTGLEVPHVSGTPVRGVLSVTLFSRARVRRYWTPGVYSGRASSRERHPGVDAAPVASRPLDPTVFQALSENVRCDRLLARLTAELLEDVPELLRLDRSFELEAAALGQEGTEQVL